VPGLMSVYVIGLYGVDGLVMCGIVGIFSPESGEHLASIHAMTDTLFRRGPDDKGVFESERLAVGMRRLSIIDLEQGAQPIFNEDKSVVVVFNGEIYNHVELREALIEKGHSYRTHSDTESLVHLYEEYGIHMLDHLRGMFAFCIWDIKNETGLLARDHFGIKPLYYSLRNKQLMFSSELKALTKTNLIARVINYQALDAYLAYTYIPAPLTIFTEANKLPPGHCITFGTGKDTVIKAYWDPNDVEQSTKAVGSCINQIEAAISDSVKAHMVSDVEISAFLSGGIDSSLVTAIAADDPKLTGAYTVKFQELGTLYDETPLAQSVADRYGIKFNTVTPDNDVEALLRDSIKAFDEPFADSSVIPTYSLCKAVAKNYKVALSGLGGDELFGGYFRYSGLYLSTYFEALPAAVRSAIGKLISILPSSSIFERRIEHAKRFIRAADLPLDRRYLSYVTSVEAGNRVNLYQPSVRNSIDTAQTENLILAGFNECRSEHCIDKAVYADLKTYVCEDILALSDRISMWHSLEIRVPLLDIRVFRSVYALPPGQKFSLFVKKAVLRKVARKFLPKKLFKAKKQGFESPMSTLLRTQLRSMTLRLLSRERIERQAIFDSGEVDKLVVEHMEGKAINSKIIFALLMFQVWYDENIR
jgi:asparagine synthase (glutamine-hydrolysing)